MRALVRRWSPWLALALGASGCSLVYPLDYATTHPDVAVVTDAPDASDASDASDAPVTDAPVTDAPVTDATIAPCPAGFLRCGSEACIDVQTNVSRCGACDTVCALAGATPACEMGRCVVASCNEGLGDCDGDLANGCETRVTTSTEHCGRCGVRCAPEHATGVCADAVCRIMACAAGYADCDGNPANGCEVNVGANPDQCGVCGRACSAAGGEGTCFGGVCGVRCDAAHGDCNGSAADGCEVTLATTTAHCGACNRPCSAVGGTPSCVAGACSIACASNRGNCDRSVANGCEADLLTDPANCGACGVLCATGTSCSRGACLAACPPGQTSCSGRCVDLASDPRACGACSIVCAMRANSAPTCASSACAYACDAGWGDCNALAVDGCETNLRASVASCGVCGRACSLANATARCNGGACEPASCNAGFGDCDGNPANGCEVALATSATHCGRCNNACAPSANGAGLCVAGACGLTCRESFRDCDGNYSNGCEVNAGTDIANCGRCGNQCSLPNVLTQACTNGVCAVGTCRTGYGDCDGNPANGCEVFLATSSVHCGACNQACGGVCTAGVCVSTMLCGGDGQACCAGGACTRGFCVGGRCQSACGGPDLRCCPSNLCTARTYCSGAASSAMCIACGAGGQRCCPDSGDACDVGLTCDPTSRECRL